MDKVIEIQRGFDDPAPGGRIHSVCSEIIDIPTIRPHRLSSLAVTAQSYVLVRICTEDGVEGIGEAATLGGPRWSEESVETIKAIVDTTLGPVLIGQSIAHRRATQQVMDRAAKRNNAAKGALATAILDALGKSMGLPVHMLLGGMVRERVPVVWALASGDPVQELEEAHAMIEAGRHRLFKVKIGRRDAADDIARIAHIAAGIEGKGRILVVDANQAWSETTADRWMPALDEIGIGLIEQPLPHWNLAGAARLAARHQLPILADESVFSPHDAMEVAHRAAADAVSLKLVKQGGLDAMGEVAAIARAAGLGIYGGGLLETTVGTAAHLHLYASLPEITWGSECFGPRVLRDDVAAEPLEYSDFTVKVPTEPGLGIVLDEDKVAHYRRRDGGRYA